MFSPFFLHKFILMNKEIISSVLIDSGGGWFNSEKPTAMLFGKPHLSIRFLNSKIHLFSDERNHIFSADPIAVLDEYTSKGYYAIGYIGYNYLEYTNRGFKTSEKKDGTKFPQVYFHFYKPKDLSKIPYSDIGYFIDKSIEFNSNKVSGPISNIKKEEYLKKVNLVKEYIAAGDIYQVNLSQRFYSDPILDPRAYFLKLYKTQPVPYSAFIDFNEFQLLSGSMELFLRKEKNKITTRPIKGTAKRGEDETSDVMLKKSLASSIKERAENVMIVDLMRNDLGRICEYGSIKVNKLFEVEGYETLYQMESEIEGNLKDGLTLSEIIYNTFPPGSVTGAPKRRALEIIDEIEPHYRGPYCGAICFIKPDGDFTMSVAIRVKVNTKEGSSFWVGGGIVWDSDPKSEYDETILKSKAIITTTHNR